MCSSDFNVSAAWSTCDCNHIVQLFTVPLNDNKTVYQLHQPRLGTRLNLHGSRALATENVPFLRKAIYVDTKITCI